MTAAAHRAPPLAFSAAVVGGTRMRKVTVAQCGTVPQAYQTGMDARTEGLLDFVNLDSYVPWQQYFFFF